MRYFVTGATGFIGRFLVERLLKREGTIYVLVREGSRARLEELISVWDAEPGRIVPVIGDVTARTCSASRTPIASTLEGVEHFFHLAAIYDMAADDEQQPATERRRDPQGGRARQRDRAQASSTTSARSRSSGRYRGLFRENMFDEGQEFDDPYSRTKFESEKLVVRDEATVPWRVYRPGDRRRQLADRRDGQDRRPVLLLQGHPEAA